MTDGVGTLAVDLQSKLDLTGNPVDRINPLGGPEPRTADGHRIWPGLVSLGLYTFCSTLLYGGYSWTSSTRITGCACGDQVQEVWFLAWPAYALTHWHNLFLSTWMNYPKGVNLATNTSFPLLGIIGAPITWLMGPVATYNFLLRLALVASAFSMCLVLRRWTTWWPAAFFGGLLYGFSPYMVGQGAGHVFLTFAPFPPLIVLAVDQIIVLRRWAPWKSGGVLGLLVVAQFLVSPEVLVLTVISVAIGCTIFVLARFREVRAAFSTIVRSLAWAVGIALALLAYPVWVLIAGPQHITGPPHPVADLANYPGDLFGIVVPTIYMRTAPDSLVLIGNKFTGGSITENGMYLGLPLLIAAVGFTLAFRRYRPLLLAAAVAVCTWLISLGSHLTIDAHMTGVILPFAVLAKLPFVQDILAVRFSGMTMLYVAAVFAMGLSHLRDRLIARQTGAAAPAHWRHETSRLSPSRWVAIPSLAIASVVVVSLVPRAAYPAVPTNVPALFTTSAVSAIPDESVVLTYPYPVDPNLQGMLDQASASMRYKITGGSAFTPNPDGTADLGAQMLTPPEMQQLFYAAFAGGASEASALPPLQAAVPAIREYLVRYGVSTVIFYRVGADPQTVVRYMTAAIGPPTLRSGAVGWFDVATRLRTVTP